MRCIPALTLDRRLAVPTSSTRRRMISRTAALCGRRSRLPPESCTVITSPVAETSISFSPAEVRDTTDVPARTHGSQRGFHALGLNRTEAARQAHQGGGSHPLCRARHAAHRALPANSIHARGINLGPSTSPRRCAPPRKSSPRFTKDGRKDGHASRAAAVPASHRPLDGSDVSLCPRHEGKSVGERGQKAKAHRPQMTIRFQRGLQHEQVLRRLKEKACISGPEDTERLRVRGWSAFDTTLARPLLHFDFHAICNSTSTKPSSRTLATLPMMPPAVTTCHHGARLQSSHDALHLLLLRTDHQEIRSQRSGSAAGIA